MLQNVNIVNIKSPEETLVKWNWDELKLTRTFLDVHTLIWSQIVRELFPKHGNSTQVTESQKVFFFLLQDTRVVNISSLPLPFSGDDTITIKNIPI